MAELREPYVSPKISDWPTFIERALAAPRQEPTDEPDPHRTDHLQPGTPEWARIGSAGHRCRRCDNGCGTSSCHVTCCGTGHCTGHPCPACTGPGCTGRGPRPDADAHQQLGLFDIATLGSTP